jgi:polysaccharide deacetylase family protein (PEP-CTERM system associated)
MPLTHPIFLLTIDVEDWFQVENFKSAIPFSSWDDMELRVERNTNKILDLFDEISESFSSAPWPMAHRPSPIVATFFTLGWIAKRFPGLVREIQKRGHEIASHGYHHHLCSEQSNNNLRKDLEDSKKLLEDILDSPVHGYRAPSFSVTNDILKTIEDAGYRYDASYNSFDKHGRYGKIDLNGFQKHGIAYKISNNFHELPVSNISFNRIPNTANRTPFILPWSGGGYFRLFPLNLFKMGTRKLLAKDGAYHFYIHPWEIDSDQPRVNNISRMFKFRHYVNIHKTVWKLKNLIKSFSHCRFQTLSQYIETLGS